MAMKPARFYVDDRPDAGVFRVHRDVYSDPEIFIRIRRFSSSR
jgi:hypothetical protein